MADSSVIGLRARPWSLSGNHLVRTNESEGQTADVWAIEKCTILSYSDGKSYLNWKSIYDFPTKEQAMTQMRAMQPQLVSIPQPKKPEPPQAGDLILLQASGELSGSIGLIEGVYGQFSESLDVHLNPETSWICKSASSRQLTGTGGIQYKVSNGLLVDSEEIIYHEFKYGFPSPEENKCELLPVRLYVVRIEAQATSDTRKTA